MSEPLSGDRSQSSSIFMGTPDFAIPSLKTLAECPRVKIHAVITQPDRPKGRGMKLQPTPVKGAAGQLDIPVFQPHSLKSEVFSPILKTFPPLDFIFVIAYGKKIPDYLLEYSRYGCINLHPSLLPKYRGGAPMRRALFNGEQQTGVTTMYLDQGWDTGDLIFQETLEIEPEITYGELSEKLAYKGASLMVRTVEAILGGTAPRTKQDESQATHEPLLTPEEEWIDWNAQAETIIRKIRGLNPEPTARTMFRDSILKVFQASIVEDCSNDKPPGTLVESSKSLGLLVSTGRSVLRLDEVQPHGKRKMSASDFRNGYRVESGELFTSPSSES